MNVEQAFKSVKSLYKVEFSLKTEQFVIISDIISTKNVFVILPSGFGKSETFVFPPLILDEVSEFVCLTVRDNVL